MCLGFCAVNHTVLRQMPHLLPCLSQRMCYWASLGIKPTKLYFCNKKEFKFRLASIPCLFSLRDEVLSSWLFNPSGRLRKNVLDLVRIWQRGHLSASFFPAIQSWKHRILGDPPRVCPVLLAWPWPPEVDLGDEHVISRHLPYCYSFSSEAFLICFITCFDYLIDFWIKPPLSELSFLIPGDWRHWVPEVWQGAMGGTRWCFFPSLETLVSVISSSHRAILGIKSQGKWSKPWVLKGGVTLCNIDAWHWNVV